MGEEAGQARQQGGLIVYPEATVTLKAKCPRCGRKRDLVAVATQGGRTVYEHTCCRPGADPLCVRIEVVCVVEQVDALAHAVTWEVL